MFSFSLQNCGRPSIPEQLWVYESGIGGLSAALLETPVIRPLSLKGKGKNEAGDDHALPAFAISASHKMKGSKNP